VNRELRWKSGLIFVGNVYILAKTSADDITHLGAGMNNIFSTHDFYARCFDAAIPLAIGIFGLIYYPWRIRREVASGKSTEEQGQTKLKKVKTLCYFAIIFGLYLIVSLFFK
jgi:hypothetical protein